MFFYFINFPKNIDCHQYKSEHRFTWTISRLSCSEKNLLNFIYFDIKSFYFLRHSWIWSIQFLAKVFNMYHFLVVNLFSPFKFLIHSIILGQSIARQSLNKTTSFKQFTVKQFGSMNFYVTMILIYGNFQMIYQNAHNAPSLAKQFR